MSEAARVRARLAGPQPEPQRISPVESPRAPSPRSVSWLYQPKANQPPAPTPNDRMWSVPVGAWVGEACVILGGGPSLRQELVPGLQGRARVIALNNAYLLAPWADVLFAPDRRWWEWNASEVHQYRGPVMLTRQRATHGGVHRIRWNQADALSRDPGSLAGWCAGGNAINMACLFGAKVIILMGFDMKPGNWHALHKAPHVEGQHRNKFIPAIERMAPELEAEGVTVINTNPESALRCFPFAGVEELLMHDDLAAIEQARPEMLRPGVQRSAD